MAIVDELYSKPLTAEELKAAKSNGYEWESMFYEPKSEMPKKELR